MLRVAIVGLLLAAGWAAAAWFLQRPLLFPRALLAGRVPRAAPAGIEQVWLDVPGGRVEGWYLPAGPARAGAVLMAHGNAEAIDHQLDLAAAYNAMGLHVLLAEYRGYGRSAGTPSEAAITEDLVRFHDRLAARAEVDPARIVLHGRSLGGAAVLQLALQRPAAALVLEKTFTSVADMARGYLVPRFLVRDPFDSLDAIRRVTCPLLILQARGDTIVPLAHGERLHAAAPDSRLVLLEGDHNDAPVDAARFWSDIESFLRDARVLPVMQSPSAFLPAGTVRRSAARRRGRAPT
ncbi:MAG: alpha/beta hydrolase [Acidobacteria bacterium]|nr:alpha/beta hydrolase [Acidobacteriota bacterium]